MIKFNLNTSKQAEGNSDIEVTYMSGAGNTFSVINADYLCLEIETLKKIAPALCLNRLSGEKTEGLISIGSSDEAELDFKADFFNPDGSFGAMCGNGARCAVHFAISSGIVSSTKEQVSFSMAGKVYFGKILRTKQSTNYSIKFPPPESQKKAFLNIEKKLVEAEYVNVGSDHIVIDFNELSNSQNIPFEDFLLEDFAKPIRYSKEFEPNGVNVNIYEIIDTSKIRLRTYERGVEAETGACGTGAISAALTYLQNYRGESPVTIIPTSGIPLTVRIHMNPDGSIQNVELEGPAEITGKSIIKI